MMRNSIGQAFDLTLQDSLFDPDAPGSSADERPAFASRKADTVLYRVFIYLEGRHVSMVENVVYQLHPTVSPSEARVVRTPRNPRCKMDLQLWGTFEISAVVTMRTGDVLRLSHQLTFDRDIQKAGTKFVKA